MIEERVIFLKDDSHINILNSMRRQIFFIMIILCILHGCKEKPEWDEVYIDLSKYESTIDLHQYSDSLRFIKLELTEESLISRINMLFEDDSLLIVLDIGNKSIHIFNSSGQHYRTITRNGKGPGEYIRICDIEIDKEKDLIHLYDDNLRKIISYDYRGEFIDELDLPEFLIRSFAKRKNGNFIAFSYDDNSPLRDGIWEFNKNGELSKVFSEVDEKYQLGWFVYPYFTRIDDNYSYLNFFDNYIYTLSNNELRKTLKVNIKQKIPDKYVSNQYGLGIANEFTGEYYMPNTLNETYNYYHFMNRSFRSDPGRIHVFIEKNSHELIIGDSLICDFENYRNIEKVFSNEGKNFFGVLESNSDDNPALVVFNLKSIGE